MIHKKLLVLGTVLCFVTAASAGFCAEKDAVTPEMIAKITEAAPEAPQATPDKARTLLVFSLCNGFVHDAVPVGAKALEILGQKSGAFTVVVSDDIALFEPEAIGQFDAICFNNTTGESFLPKNFDALDEQQKQQAQERDARLKKSLLEYVRNGGGIVGIHAATDTLYQWDAFGELIGGYFNGHPWNEDVHVKVDDPTHPVNAAFEGKDFVIADEIYQFREPYSRDKLRVLLSLNTSLTNMDKGEAIRRNDNDFAISWVSSHGEGRVFYCSLGHRKDVFWNPQILKHYLDGIQFAFGDLKADTTPSNRVTDEDGWRNLFNAKDLTGWQCKPGSWVVVDGVLERRGGGDIWSVERFADFVLDLEFNVGPGTNSGVFFRTDNIADCVQTGIEMQVLDSHGVENLNKHHSGAIYDCLTPSKNTMKPAGEWNHAILKAIDNKIEIELNGEPIIDMDLNEWTEPNKNPDGSGNKFRTAYKDMVRDGHIGFQDHGNPVSYRNIKIRRLK